MNSSFACSINSDSRAKHIHTHIHTHYSLFLHSVYVPTSESRALSFHIKFIDFSYLYFLFGLFSQLTPFCCVWPGNLVSCFVARVTIGAIIILYSSSTSYQFICLNIYIQYIFILRAIASLHFRTSLYVLGFNFISFRTKHFFSRI